ncbi:MAG: hypothetical protein KME43_11330 [Myxacorys chilensis ATA2-1-KO14]|jgi:hypothetical protein|nr:hypothetical protein [Myxacorys chilensis ATA2-1-KO14]
MKDFIGWALIAIAVVIIAPKVPLAIELISTRLNQDFGRIPQDMPPVRNPNQQRPQP